MKLFGTDGIRGVANEYPMTPDFITKLGQVCGEEICTNKKKVLIAKDTRVSSSMIEASLATGFTSVGVDVVLLGVLPTPVLTAVTKFYDVDMAVMITASHNQYTDNGIKLINSVGDKFDDEVTLKIENSVLGGEVKLSANKIGEIVNCNEAKSKYLDIVSKIVSSRTALKGLRVVVDCANGAFSEFLPDVFMKLGAGVIAIANEPNGTNINNECGSQHIEKLQETVIATHANMGIAVDGDGDRIVVCDEQGNKIPTEQVIAFVASYLDKNDMLKGKTIVSTIVANTGLEKYAKDMGWMYYSTKVGERYVIEKMQEVGANVGGEESGHVVVSDFSKTGDGLVVSLLVAMGVCMLNKKLSEIFPVFDMQPLFYENFKFANREILDKLVNDENIQRAVKKAEDIMADNGRAVLRSSGTEPVIRVWICGADENKVAQAGNLIKQEISNFC